MAKEEAKSALEAAKVAEEAEAEKVAAIKAAEQAAIKEQEALAELVGYEL